MADNKPIVPSSNKASETPPEDESEIRPPEQLPVSSRKLLPGLLFLLLLILILSLIFQKTTFQKRDTISLTKEDRRVENKPQASNWQSFTSTNNYYSFEYPPDYKIKKGEKGTELLEKVNVFHSSYSLPIMTIIVWKSPQKKLSKNDIESWCFNTLLNEARKEQMLCAFFSPAAITDTAIDKKDAYSINYYNSSQEKVTFYVIPQDKSVITISAVSILNDKRLDTGKSQVNEILNTLTLTK